MTRQSAIKFHSDFYTINKQYDKALTYSEKFHSATDSMNNNDLQLQLKKMEQQYNLEKKEKEIVLLKRTRNCVKLIYKKRELLTPAL